jgi:hypothetical protein
MSKLLTLLPAGVTPSSRGFSEATASRIAQCIRPRRAMSSCQAASESVTGRGNQLDPFSGKEPRFSPSSRRRTTYFQYAACSATSQMLCRPSAGRCAATAALTPRTEPRRFGPCHDRRS